MKDWINSGFFTPGAVSTPDDTSTAGTNERVQVFDVQYDAASQSPLQGVGALIDRIKGVGFGA